MGVRKSRRASNLILVLSLYMPEFGCMGGVPSAQRDGGQETPYPDGGQETPYPNRNEATEPGCIAANCGVHSMEASSSGTGTMEASSTGTAESLGRGANSIAHEAVGVTHQALNTAETTLISSSGLNFAETFAVPFQNSSGTWEMVALTDTNTSSWVSTRMDYACTNNNYSSWCSHTLSGLSNNGGDVSAIYRSASSPRYIYVAKMFNDATGFRLFRSSEPCPGSCGSAGWSWVDFPRATSSIWT